MLLAGDVGGTKTLLGLFERGEIRPVPRTTRSYLTTSFSTVAEILDVFLRDVQHPPRITAAALGVAGPVVHGRARLTNVQRDITADEVRSRLGTARVQLLNDLEATAHVLELLTPDEVCVLQEGEPSADGAAAVIFLAGIFDLTDGPVARRQGRVTAFGAFFDSMIDRYSDMVLYMGLLVYYAVIGRFFYVVLTAVAMAGSFMVSYSRARAESLIPACKVGFMERPERVVLLIIGGAFNRMAPVLWVIAVLSTVTVIHRILFTWQETNAGRTLPGVGAPQ